MEAIEIICDLRYLGIKIMVDGDSLGLMPISEVPADLQQKVKNHKAAIIEHLSKKLPCVKGTGACILITDGNSPFSCIFERGAGCQFNDGPIVYRL